MPRRKRTETWKRCAIASGACTFASCVGVAANFVPNMESPETQASLIAASLLASCLAAFFTALAGVRSPSGRQRRRKPSPPKGGEETLAPPAVPSPAELDEAQYQAVLASMPYAKKSLMTKEERRFWGVLLKALRGSGVSVTVKPSLKEFVRVPDYEEGDVTKRAWREIAQKHVDFLVCDGKTMRPLYAVEYDGATHERDNADNAATIRSDDFKDRLFKKLGIPLVRVPYGEWTPESLRERLDGGGAPRSVVEYGSDVGQSRY